MECGRQEALSFDGTELYFFSEKPGGFGGRDLYVSTRARLRGSDTADNARDETRQRGGRKEKE